MADERELLSRHHLHGARVVVQLSLLQWRMLMIMADQEHREPRKQLMAMIDQWWADDPRRPPLEAKVRAEWHALQGEEKDID